MSRSVLSAELSAQAPDASLRKHIAAEVDMRTRELFASRDERSALLRKDNEAELRDISDIGSMPTVEDQWVRVTCEGGDQAWLLYASVIEHPGVVPSPMLAYGEASDIAPEDAEQIRMDAEANRLAYEGVEPGSLE